MTLGTGIAIAGIWAAVAATAWADGFVALFVAWLATMATEWIVERP